MSLSIKASAQYKTVEGIKEEAAKSEMPVVISLDDALMIALSENISVKIADKEIQRKGFAKQGSYAALFPQIDVSGAYQRTIKKQVMYMDFDMSAFMGPGGAGGEGAPEMPSMDKGLEIGRWNTWSGGVTAAMPLINAQVWKSIKISGLDVELAVEKAKESRLDMVTQVKTAYFSTLLAKEVFNVYKEVYENALKNLEETQKKYNVQKTSEFELIRSKTTLANAIPNVYDAESRVILALWQLKAVLGVDLDLSLDIVGNLADFSGQMFYDIHQHDEISLANNSTMKQLAIQAEQLAQTIRVQEFAYIPSVAAVFNFSINAMANDYNFSQYRWTPHSYVGLSLNIPIFSGGKRFNDVRQAKNMRQQLELQTINVERQLKIAIRSNLNTMETSMKSYTAAQNAVEAARKGYSIAEKAYQVGHSTLIELNDAQLALTQSKLGELQAIYNFLIAKAQLEQTLGQDFITE